MPGLEPALALQDAASTQRSTQLNLEKLLEEPPIVLLSDLYDQRVTDCFHKPGSPGTGPLDQVRHRVLLATCAGRRMVPGGVFIHRPRQCLSGSLQLKTDSTWDTSKVHSDWVERQDQKERK